MSVYRWAVLLRPVKHFLMLTHDCVRSTANLELASLPTTTPENRKNLLSFVVCGGGPTGVEFAAELADMMSEDVLSYVSPCPPETTKTRWVEYNILILLGST